MKVMKFGGTSVGSPERMREVATLITQSGEPTFVVLTIYICKWCATGIGRLVNRFVRKKVQRNE